MYRQGVAVEDLAESLGVTVAGAFEQRAVIEPGSRRKRRAEESPDGGKMSQAPPCGRAARKVTSPPKIAWTVTSTTSAKRVGESALCICRAHACNTPRPAPALPSHRIALNEAAPRQQGTEPYAER